MVGRLSTNVIYKLLGSQVIENQNRIVDLSKVINSGKKFATSTDDPVALIGAISTQGRILENNQGERDRNLAIADLQASEAALTTMNDIVDRIKEIAIRGGSDSNSLDERTVLKDELRTLGATIVQLANSKSGDKYLFSGEQSNVKTIRLNNTAPFSTAIYKNNQDNGEERHIGDITTSISLKDTLVSLASTAKLESGVVNPVTTTAGNLDFEVNDGSGNVYNFTVAVAIGDNITNIINNINTAFTGAGGAGALAQESPAGYLSMDTALITGNTANSQAKIQVLASSTTALTNELHIKKQNNFGKDMGLLQTLAQLENDLSTDNSAGVRALLDNLKFNSSQINAGISQVGLQVAAAERFNLTSEDLDIKLQSDLSIQQDIDVIDANIKMANAQAALQTSLRTASNFFSQSLINFIGG